MNVDALLITPPFTQLNTPYPATAYLKGFLNTQDISTYQIDLGIEVILELFSKKGLKRLFEYHETNFQLVDLPSNISRILSLREDYIDTIDAVIKFLQGKSPNLARQIVSEPFLPQAARFSQIDDLEWAFGTMGLQDKAKHLATLYLEDLSDFIVACVDKNFGFSRYAEQLGRSANSFDDLQDQLQQNETYIDEIALRILSDTVVKTQPKLVCISVPFPGNLYSAFRCAKHIKKCFPGIKVSMGGGFPNTELRSLSDTRVFKYFDFITLDDGELPVLLLIKNISAIIKEGYKRTFLLENNQVIFKNDSIQKDFKQSELGTPDYTDLLLDQYISTIEIANPMHSLWNDGRWNKLTMAHGCYWGKCTFCDISLDYIKLYEPLTAKLLVDRMEEIIAKTGENGFHFVDEAAPPALMRELALEIIKRKLIVTWWTNIRFEKSFTYDLCVLLKASGCIAVSGGLEVASDRLLALIKKGVTVAQVAQVTNNFTKSGIMVHAYLMYGYPTQTVQETIDSLEMVRQLFEMGIVQSGFWHQFAMTAHSPIGLDPESFGVIPKQNKISFANNDIEFLDKTKINHNKFSFGLKKALFNYMHGVCFDYLLQDWFDFKIPRTTVSPNFIYEAINRPAPLYDNPNAKVVWLGKIPQIKTITKSKKGFAAIALFAMTFHNKTDTFTLQIQKNQGEWLFKMLENNTLKSINNNKDYSSRQTKLLTFQDIKSDYETYFDDFEIFWYTKSIQKLRQFGLLII